MISGDAMLPTSNEAEQAALGACLYERKAIAHAKEILRPDDFYRHAHQWIYAAILELYQRNEPVDIITLGTLLQSRPVPAQFSDEPAQQLAFIGGTLYLTTLMDEVPTAAGITYYAGIVREMSIRRRLIKSQSEIVAAAHNLEMPLPELLAISEQRIVDVSDRLRTGDAPRLIGELARDQYYRMEDAITNGHSDGFKTPWKSINRIISPMRPGQLTIVGARPGMGKTAFMLQLALSLAEQGIPGYIFSMEMEDTELGLRAVLTHMSHEQSDVDDLEYCVANSKAVLDDMGQAVSTINDYQVAVDDRPGLTPQQIEQALISWRRQHWAPAWAMVDFVGLAKGGRRYGSRAEEAGDVVYQIAAIAKRQNIHIIALSQLNRDCEQLVIKRPEMHHLAESGKVEQAAYRVLYLYRPGHYGDDEIKANMLDPDRHENITEVGLLKQRGGGRAKTSRGRMVRRALLYYDGGNFRFRELKPGELNQSNEEHETAYQRLGGI